MSDSIAPVQNLRDSPLPQVGDEVEIQNGSLAGHRAVIYHLFESLKLYWVTIQETGHKVLLIDPSLRIVKTI